ncbi:chitin deacetylase [Chlamydoabsidia padenii]|nr:chitin deacetylase [Chlamydoabsidia padenii]
MTIIGLTSIVAVAAFSPLTAAAGYWQSFNSSINPLNITIPDIPQTTSIDPTTECAYYNPDPSLIVIDPTQWPTSWSIATSNGMNSSAEFQSFYNSIDWANAPNIPVRTLNADGSINMNGYDSSADPNCWWTASTCTIPKLKDVNADIYECPEPETWGLTYDDGPNCSHNAFYDYLQQQDLKASMFYIGSNVIDWPYGAMRGVRDGHHVASHTWSHRMMTTLTNQELVAEFYYTQKAIKLATGLTPRYWRAPYGDVDDRVRWIATQMNLTSILWDYDTNDWSAGTTETVQQVQASYDEFIQMGSNGTMSTHGNIVLTHEIANVTMSLALTNLPKIMQNYKHVVNVATCQNITYPYMENTVAFRSFDEYLAQNTSAAGAASSIVGSNTNGGVTATGQAATQSSASSDASFIRAYSSVLLLPLLLTFL